MLIVSITGAALIGAGILENRGIAINQDMIELVLKVGAFGASYWILHLARALFL